MKKRIAIVLCITLIFTNITAYAAETSKFESTTNPLTNAGALTDDKTYRHIIDIDLEGDGDRDFIAYYDADGYDDELAFDEYDGKYEFFVNDGNGGFSRSVPNVSLPRKDGSQYLCADFDNDGDEDIFAPGSYFTNDGDGNFTSATNPLISAGSLTDDKENRYIIDIDLEGDGDRDFIAYYDAEGYDDELATNTYGGNFIFFINDGNGGFSRSVPNVSLPLINGSEYLCADFDNDGDEDIFAPGSYFTNDGDGNFTSATNPLISAGATTDDGNRRFIVDGDFDTDGDVDFLSYDGSAYCFFYNDGSGGFSKSVPSVSLPLKNGAEYLCTDFDNDGDDDVFAPTGYFTQGGSAAGTDNKPPKITTTTPANNAIGISGDTNIVLNFDESVTTSGDGNIIIYKASDDSVVETIPGNSTKVTGSGSSSITIDPEITLADSTSFYINIEPKAVLDIDGMSMWIKDNTTLKFTTGTSADPLTGTAIIDNSSPTYGDILTGSIADGHNGTGAATYVWYRDNSVIDGATSATYNVKKDDVGKVLKFGVSYADQTGELTTSTSAVEKKSITIKDVTATNRQYDGTTEVALSNGTLQDIGSDTVTFTLGTGTVSSASVGTDKAVTTNITLGGADAGVYTLIQPIDVTVNITKKLLSINTVAINDKAYDGTTTATANGVTFTGLENSETLVLDTDFTLNTLNFVDANVENSKIVTGTLSLSSTPKADNYVLSSSDISTTGNIVKAGTLIATDPSTLESVEGIGGSDTFDLDTIGLNKADAGTLSYSLGALTDVNSIFTTIPSINGSELSFNIKSSATEGQTATQEIVISSDQYEDTTVTITFDIINKTPVTISGITVSDKVYDGNVLTYSGVPSYSPAGYDGTGLEYNWSVQGGSSLGSVPTDVGDYTLTIKIPDSNSLYSGEVTHNVSIMKKDISVESVLVDNKTYDADTDANVTSVTFTGLASGESLVLDTDYTVSSADFTNKNAGTAKSVTGTVTLVATSLSDNYTLSDGTFSSTANIIQKVISTNTVTVNDKAYDGTTTATANGVTFNGLENNETLVLGTDFTLDTLNFVDANVENSKTVTGTLSLSSTPKADNYVLSSGDISTTGNIVKAGTLIATDPSTLEFVEGIGGSDTFDLDTIGLNKTDAGTLSYSLGTLTDVDSIFTTPPAISLNILSFDVKSSATDGQTATQEIVISSDKYDDTTATITFDIKQLKTNTIMFVTNSDSEIAEITVTSGSAITAPTNPTKSGYTFKGWYRDSDLMQLWDFDSEVTEDMTLYAKWKKRSSSSDQPSIPTEINIGDVEGDNVKGDVEKKDERLDIIVDKDSLDNAIDDSDEGAVLNIDTMSDTEETNVIFTVNDIEKMAAKGLVISVETEKAIYALPTNDINIDVVKEVFGEEVGTTEIAFKVTQKETSLLMEKVIIDIAEDNEIEVLMPSIDFELTASYGGKSVAIKSFNSYVTRKIALPEDINLSKVTTATITKEDGTIYHVPTYIEEIDGIYYAVVNSLTNSTYTLIYNEKNFADIDMWAKSSIENMTNRLIMDGDTDIKFNPYRDITRAEFIEAVVKALGLAPADYVEYIDVDTNEEYAGYIQTASEYGIINGIGGELFAPDSRITRQDAMVILYRISSIMDYDGNEYNIDLNKYEDYADVSDYAKLAVTWNVNCSIVVGKSETILDPKANITKAEVAIVIEKILKKSGLID